MKLGKGFMGLVVLALDISGLKNGVMTCAW